MPELVHNHRDNDAPANDDVRVRIWNGQLAATAANHRDDQRSHHGSKD